MSSRADRRRQERGGSGPPPRRDPMTSIYIGLGIVIVLIFAGFGIMAYVQNSARNAQLSFVNSTPTPGPNAKSKPIVLQPPTAVGKNFFKVAINQSADLPTGGRGALVDGIPCESMEQAILHVHTELSLFVNGKQIAIPRNVGIVGTLQGVCLYWIHTHDATGIIHVEAGSAIAPAGGNYTLGNFFDIWGQPLSRTQVGPFKGAVTAFVNGAQYNGDLSSIPLRSHQEVVLEVGAPIVAPRIYTFPPGV
ncbi:MAG TPA: hypothetical protein VFO29_08680 [Candidatus Rubrimentiphilum sp.]|nr:hypothetical protein [Candidatus Rubrimentiphilum sp.]